MVDRNLIREFNISDDELQEAFGQSLASVEEIEEGEQKVKNEKWKVNSEERRVENINPQTEH